MRKEKVIDKRIFEELCAMACTEQDICSVLGVSTPTLLKFCKKEYGRTFKEIYPVLSVRVRVSLRKAQFESAMKGNARMLIWLGKQYLGQSEHPKQNNEQENDLYSEVDKILSEYD